MTGLTLVICRSSVGMMQRLTHEPGASLFCRLTSDPHLRPMDYRAVQEIYPHLLGEERVLWYGVFGGIPFYHNLGAGLDLETVIWPSSSSGTRKTERPRSQRPRVRWECIRG